jgi:hypothetical protein
LYPNPVKDILFLDVAGYKVKVKIFSVSFRKVFSREYDLIGAGAAECDCSAGKMILHINLSFLARGAYYLIAEDETGARSVREVLILR